MRAILLLASMLLSGGAGAGVIRVQATPDGTDRATVAACLRESREAPQSCIGSIAVPCSARQSPAGGSVSQITCGRREAGVWRERLDLAGNLAGGQLDAGARSRFAAVQRAWESFVAQKCALLGELSAPAQAAGAQAACELREVALRAIDLERLARRARESSAAPRRPELQR